MLSVIEYLQSAPSVMTQAVSEWYHVIISKQVFARIAGYRQNVKSSFLAFSNARAIVKTPTWIDMPFKYVPFKLCSLVKRIM